MKFSVIINNFNYSEFIIECVESALSQTYQDIEVIVVDDGSTDNSIELLESHYSKNDKIKIVKKRNGGQLSTFNEAVKHISGEIVCFLDSDDIYKENYLEELIKIYEINKDVDFVYCAIERFFDNGKKEVIKKYENDKVIGFSTISSLYGKEWVGSVTSAISMRTELFKKIVPIVFEKDWITRADDCLIWGSSIFGAKKYYCSKSLILYRVHGSNFYYGKNFSTDYLYKREFNINKLFNLLKNSAGISDEIIDLVSMEYKTRGDKDFELLKLYFKIIVNSKKSLFQKFKLIVKLLIIHIKEQK